MMFATVRLFIVLAFSLAVASGVALAQKKYDPGATDAEIKIGLEHLAFMKRFLPEGNPIEPFNVAGRIAAGVLIQILTQCGDDLTHENVMRQAESLRDFSHPLLLPGIKITTGPADHYPIEQVQLQRFDGKEWVRFGEVLPNN